jgi:hypothetical protein
VDESGVTDSPPIGRIAYDVTVEDCVAWNRRLAKKRRCGLSNQIATVLLLTGAGALLGWWAEGPFWRNFLWATLGVSLVVALLGVWGQRNLDAAARRSGLTARSVIGRHVMEVGQGRLWSRSEVHQTGFDLSALFAVESLPEYLFIHTASNAAWIVPRGRVAEGDVGAFEGALLEALPAAGGPSITYFDS